MSVGTFLIIGLYATLYLYAKVLHELSDGKEHGFGRRNLGSNY